MDWLSMKRWSPYAVGIWIGILSWFTFLLSDKPIGCSTAFAPTSDMIERLHLMHSCFIIHDADGALHVVFPRTLARLRRGLPAILLVRRPCGGVEGLPAILLEGLPASGVAYCLSKSQTETCALHTDPLPHSRRAKRPFIAQHSIA